MTEPATTPPASHCPRAAHATRWTSTNLGPRTEITHAGYTWTVELPAEGEGNARICGRYGHGGTELLNVPATPGQTIPIVEAAMSALRAPLGDSKPPQRWEVDNFGDIISIHDSEQEAKERVRQLLLIGRANPRQVSVQWRCSICENADGCPSCEASPPGEQVAFLKADGCGPIPTSYSVHPAT